MSQGLYTPSSTSFGSHTSLPILSCRDVDLSVSTTVLAADVAQPFGVPPRAQAIEIDVINTGSGPVTLWLIATQDQSLNGIDAIAKAGLRRVIPPGYQLVEEHGVKGGDLLVMVATGALDVRVASRLAGDAS